MTPITAYIHVPAEKGGDWHRAGAAVNEAACTGIQGEGIVGNQVTSLENRSSERAARVSLRIAHAATVVGRASATAISGLAVFGISIYLILNYGVHVSRNVGLVPLVAVLVLGGAPLLFNLVKKALRGEFGSDWLAGISIITAVLLKEYLVAAIVVLMLSSGAALEQFASKRASSVLSALAKRMPAKVHCRRGENIEEVAISSVRPGDALVVFPHEICPVDGTVTDGNGRMDESYLTGEPFEISKAPGSAVLSGAINGDTALTIRAERTMVDSRYAKIMRVMEEAEQRRPQLRRLGDRLGAWYTPLALGLAIAASIFSGQPERFLAVLVIATPCPLLIAIPVAVIGAISLSARRGIIIKNPGILEQIDRCQSLILDKTGTLTYGKPSLSRVWASPKFDENETLKLAASLEVYSKHPLASAIRKAAADRGLRVEPVTEINEPPGQGLSGKINGRSIWLTSRSKVPASQNLPPVDVGLECIIFIDGVFAAALQFRDTPRTESKPFLSHLWPRHEIARIALVSGDRDAEVRHLAQAVGITDFHGSASPEEKVRIVEIESRKRKTIFVGDGINDAPAMKAATIGVAFGVSSDIISEAADAVILETSLTKIDELIHIGRRMRTIALQSALGGIALSLLGMILAALGYLPPLAGAVAQELIDLAAVLNAVRVTLPFGQLTDFQGSSS